MREETTYVQQSTSSEANNRVASLDIGCCYYSVHKRPKLTQICNSLVSSTYLHPYVWDLFLYYTGS